MNVPFVTLTPFTDLLYTKLVASSINLSPSRQMSRAFAPSTQSSTSFFITLLTMSAAACTRSVNIPSEKNYNTTRRTLYFVMSASAVERGFSASLAGFSVSVVDIVVVVGLRAGKVFVYKVRGERGAISIWLPFWFTRAATVPYRFLTLTTPSTEAGVHPHRAKDCWCLGTHGCQVAMEFVNTCWEASHV